MTTVDDLLAAAGGPNSASLNIVDLGAAGRLVVQQVDKQLFVVGEDSYDVMTYSLASWLHADGQELHALQVTPGRDADEVWWLLKDTRAGGLTWQCGACDAWIFTRERPQMGVLPCGMCRDGGIDFRHADRAVGPGATDQ